MTLPLNTPVRIHCPDSAVHGLTGRIWQRRTRDNSPFELIACNGYPFVTVRVPGGIVPRVAYKVARQHGLDLMSNAEAMTLPEMRKALGQVGESV